MKVVHVCGVPLPPQHPDALRLHKQFHPGHWVLDLARAQKAHTSLQPELLVNVPGSLTDFEAEWDGIPVHYLRCPAKYRAKTLLFYETSRLAARLRRLQPDIVHAHGTEGAHVLAAQRSGLPYVVTAQGLYGIINSLLKLPWWHRQKVIEFLEWRALSRARHVIAKSAYIAEKLQQLYPHLVLHRIPNTFDPAIAALPSLPRKKNKLIFVGTLDERKGLDLVLEALPRIQGVQEDVSLQVIGAGRGGSDYIRKVEAGLVGLMGSRCEFSGRLPHLEVARAIASAAVLVAPSREEMFGNQVIEALLVGTPCVVSSETAMAENIHRFGNGHVFQNGHAADLAEKVLAVLASGSTPEAKSAQGKIVDYMAPERVAAAHLDVYRTILHGHP